MAIALKHTETFNVPQVFFDKSPSSGEESRPRSLGVTMPFASGSAFQPSAPVIGADQVDSECPAQHMYTTASQKIRKEKLVLRELLQACCKQGHFAIYFYLIFCELLV